MSEDTAALAYRWRRERNEARAAARLFYEWLREEWRDRTGHLARLDEVACLYDWLARDNARGG